MHDMQPELQPRPGPTTRRITLAVAALVFANFFPDFTHSSGHTEAGNLQATNVHMSTPESLPEGCDAAGPDEAALLVEDIGSQAVWAAEVC